MIEVLQKGMRVHWVEEPKLNGDGNPNDLVGPQLGEIKKIVRRKKSGLTAVLVMNRDRKHFHWIEADTACDILSPTEY